MRRRVVGRNVEDLESDVSSSVCSLKKTLELYSSCYTQVEHVTQSSYSSGSLTNFMFTVNIIDMMVSRTKQHSSYKICRTNAFRSLDSFEATYKLYFDQLPTR